MSLSDFELLRLTPEHNILPFDCDDKDLNEFLFEDAKKFQLSLLAVTYLLQSKDKTIAFFSMFNDKITVQDFDSKSQWRKIKIHFQKRRQSYPAVKLGRLGVDKLHQGQGIGVDLINYLKILFFENNKTGCKFITVDAYQKSLGFYEKAGFDYMTTGDYGKDTRLMFFDLSILSQINSK